MNNATIPAITTIVVSETTTVPVERVLAAASDFTPRRYSVFPAVSAKHTTVHASAGTSADVTEGTRVGPLVLWERCDYDWSRPDRVIATVTDSNVYATPGSSWTITAESVDGRNPSRNGVAPRLSAPTPRPLHGLHVPQDRPAFVHEVRTGHPAQP